VKLSVIMPVVDVPVGSGRAGFWLKNSIQSVLDGGHEDFECLIGCDGDVDAIRETVASFKDDRLRYIPFPFTGNWGNFQRHRLMRDYATGDYFTFMDHDDNYTKNALKEMALDIADFPGRAFFYRVLLRVGVVVWYSRDVNQPRNVAGHGVVIPRGTGYPIWGESADRLEDLKLIRGVYRHGQEIGQPVIFVETVVAHVRPWAPPELQAWVHPAEEPLQST